MGSTRTGPHRRSETRRGRRLAICGMLLMPSALAWAAARPPRFDIVAMCEATLATRAPDPRMDDCAAGEQRALTYLQTAYPVVPSRVRDRCERLSRKGSKGFGSYAFVVGCIDLK